MPKEEVSYLIKIRSFINSFGMGVYVAAGLAIDMPMKNVPILLNTVPETDLFKLEIMAIRDVIKKFDESSHLIFETTNNDVFNLLKSDISNRESGVMTHDSLIPKKLQSMRYGVQLGKKESSFFSSSMSTFDEFENTCNRLVSDYRDLNNYPVFHLEMRREQTDL